MVMMFGFVEEGCRGCDGEGDEALPVRVNAGWVELFVSQSVRVSCEEDGNTSAGGPQSQKYSKGDSEKLRPSNLVATSF